MDRDSLLTAIWGQVRPTDVVLDVGCGIQPQPFFKPGLHILCEPHAEYVQILQKRFAGDPRVLILQGTSDELLPHLPDRSVDSIFLLDLIEHLEKEDGRKLLKECERLARKQILLCTPLGHMVQKYGPGERDAWGLGGGHWQTHKSGWMPEDLDDTWTILAARVYFTVPDKGQTFDAPMGAFWAFRDCDQGPGLPERIRRRYALTVVQVKGFIRRFLKRYAPEFIYVFLQTTWHRLRGIKSS